MRFRALDGWRGIAALLVAIYHCPFYGHLYEMPAIRNAYLCVDFFFVLSGFVISHAYANRLGSPREALSFLIRRFGRIWPLHAVVLGLFVALEAAKLAAARHGLAPEHVPFSGAHGVDAIFANLGLVHSLGLYDRLTWNGPSWSISVEFWAYAAFALIALAWPRRLLAVALGSCLAVPLVIIAVSEHRPVADVTYDYGALRCLFGFLLGYLTYRLHVRNSAAAAAGLGRGGSGVEALALLAAAGFVGAVDDGLATVAAPLVFAGTIFVFAAERGAISRLLTTRPMQRLGDWSYSIYMIHILVVSVMLQFGRAGEKALGLSLLQRATLGDADIVTLDLPHSAYLMDGLGVVYLAAVVALSAVLYKFVEMPARAGFSRLADRVQRRSPAAATRGPPPRIPALTASR